MSEAADALDVTVDAVRSRIKRGTIDHVREGGRVYVLLGTDQDRPGNDQGGDQGTADPEDRTAELIATLQEQLAAERQAHAEARRLLVAALERIPPQLEASQEARAAPRKASDRGRQATMFSTLVTLVPLPREQIGARTTGRIGHLYSWWMQSPFEKYLSYAIGIVLTAASAGLDFFYSPGGVDIDMLRLLIAVAFGVYVGIKDGKKGQPLGRFNILGFLTGLLTWMVAVYVSEPSLTAAFDVGNISPIVSTGVVYFLGTWLMFISGFLLGKAVQIKAEESRGRAQDGDRPSGAHDAEAGEARSTAILGVVGVVGAALLQMLGQIVSALVGNGGS